MFKYDTYIFMKYTKIQKYNTFNLLTIWHIFSIVIAANPNIQSDFKVLVVKLYEYSKISNWIVEHLLIYFEFALLWIKFKVF